jgi:hemerythrin superfamily protein
MARAKSKTAKSKAKTSSGDGRGQDAIALLKADHRQVEEWFEQFEKARDNDRRQKLASQICGALKVHAQIEEEIFYPAFLEATQDEDMHHEAEVEHDGAKKLIADIEASTADDDYFKSKVHVLSEMIKHHVKEEEQPGGMFAEARDSDMDLVELGQRLAARKTELEGADADDDMTPPPGRKSSREVTRQMKGAR